MPPSENSVRLKAFLDRLDNIVGMFGMGFALSERKFMELD